MKRPASGRNRWAAPAEVSGNSTAGVWPRSSWPPGS